MNFSQAEKYRRPHPLGFEHKAGDDFGWFEIPSCITKSWKLYVMVAPSDSDWQHISVSTNNPTRCPFWNEMCQIKDMFFDPEDVVVQFHPRKSEYVNVAKNCLHLWKLNNGEQFPTPPTWTVG